MNTYVVETVCAHDKGTNQRHYEGIDIEEAKRNARSHLWGSSDYFVTLDKYSGGQLVETIHFRHEDGAVMDVIDELKMRIAEIRESAKYLELHVEPLKTSGDVDASQRITMALGKIAKGTLELDILRSELMDEESAK